MPALYLDNFRGFKDTFIPLKKVNFLIGENSTGKSSILSLIYLLSSVNFWIMTKFNDQNVRFGSFYDIANRNSTKNDTFKVGFFNEEIDSDSNIQSVVMNFKNSKGIPKISNISYISNDIVVVSRISDTGKSINYKATKLDELNFTISDSDFFEKFVEYIGIQSKECGFKRMKIVPKYINRISTLIQLINEEIESKNNNKEDLTVEVPTIVDNYHWIAPIRAKPSSTYDVYDTNYSPEGSHAPYILNSILSSKKNEKKKEIIQTLEEFGEDSGLFETLSIDKFKKRSEVSPFEVDVTLGEENYNITQVGYGVSQVFPILIDLVATTPERWFSIQQPEVHLHPRAQASLGDLIFKLAFNEEKNFIIETHSDYLVDRFRLNIHKNREDKKIDSQVLYFERNNSGNSVYPIEINDDGKYSKDQPDSFREFFLNESLNLLEI
ncbi:MAG: hypothetical protein CI953_1040 [Methanohalophilus sp.]|nr:MAG: hypothetical protein CI953_1040 [Methanohalophilus sp.]